MKLDTIHSTYIQHRGILAPIIYVMIFVTLNVAIPAVMGVFDVTQSTYINYVLFLNAMMVFYLMLPKKGFEFD